MRDWRTYSRSQMDQAIANALEGGAPSASLIHQAHITLNNDEIIHLPTFAPTIIPAPGANRLIALTNADGFLYLTAPYSNITALYSAITFDFGQFNGFYLSGPIDANSFLVAGEPIRRAVMLPDQQIVAAATTQYADVLGSVADMIDAPFTLMADQADGDYMDGDPANTLDLSVTFQVYDFTLKRYLTTTESGWHEDTRTFS